MRSSRAAIIQFATSDEPPAARNGVVRPVSGITPHHPADHDEDLQREHEGEPDREQLAEVVGARVADAEAAGDEQQVQAEDREDADEPELLAERRDDEVAVRSGREIRPPLAEPRPEQPAVREAEHPVDDLEAAAGLLVARAAEGVQPVGDAALDVAEDVARGICAGRGEQEAEDDPARPARGDVEHRDEHAEEQEAGAEVVLADDHAEGEHPHDEDRPEVAGAGEADEQEPAPHHGEGVPPRDEEPGEEDGERDLRDLAGLEVERADADPDVGGRAAEAQAGDQGQHEQHDRREHRDVRVALQHPVVADEEQHDDRGADAERRPEDLARPVVVVVLDARGAEVDPVDLRDPEPVDGDRDRQDERIRVPGGEAQHDVQREGEHADAARELHDVEIDVPERTELHEHDGPGGHGEGEQQQAQLDVAEAGRRLHARGALRLGTRERRRRVSHRCRSSRCRRRSPPRPATTWRSSRRSATG